MLGSFIKFTLKAAFAEGALKKHKPEKRPAPMSETFDIFSGLASMITIRDIHQNPYISFDSCKYRSTCLSRADAFIADTPSR